MTPAPIVLQVTPELDTGGVERTTLDMAIGLIAAGGTALVASRGGRLQSEIEEAGGKVFNLPVHSKNPFTILLNIVRLRRIIKDEGVDVLHVRSRAPAWSCLPAARWTGIPLVTTYHGTYTATSRLKRFYNSGMARGDIVMANSAFIAKRIRAEHVSLAPDPLIVFSGTDTDLFSQANVREDRKQSMRRAWSLAETEKSVILLPGRLTEWKGQRVLIEAAALLKADGIKDFLIILAGDAQGRDAYEQDLKDLINANGLAGHILMPGHCADMPAACAVADIIISASTAPEAFGRIAVEAQAMGKPIIASGHGGALETIIDEEPGRTGWLVTPGDAGSLAAALKQALGQSIEARAELGARGRKNAKNFSVETMVEATMTVYRELLKRSWKNNAAT